MKLFRQYLCLILLLLASCQLFAKDMSKKSQVDVKEILWGHVKDSYDWHITDIGSGKHKTSLVVHLPIIVRTTTGWHVFSSSEFSEAERPNEDRVGPYNLVIKNSNDVANPNKIVEKVGNSEVRPWDFSITKTVCILFINAIILLLVILIPARWCKKHKMDDPAPKGFTGLIHMFVQNIYEEVIVACMGKEAKRYASWLLTCFFFIFVSNLMGIVPFPPGGGNLTGNITCTFFLGVTTFLITNFTGSKEYWKEIFWPDVPTWLKVPVPLMPFIELFGIFTKPLALIVRLFANMLAGHAIALAFAAIIFIMFGIANNAIVNWLAGSGMSVVSVAMSVFMMLLELLVSYIQALVFTMLSAVFISLAHVKPHHHES